MWRSCCASSPRPRQCRARRAARRVRHRGKEADMRVTGFWTAVGAIIAGLILADVLTHPTGTKAAGGVVSSLWKTSAKGLTGK